MRRHIAFSAAAGFALVTAQALAHHGAGIFDSGKTVTVTGAVAEFQFVNPHVLIYIDVPEADGKKARWAGELTSPNRLAREGQADVKWHKDILKPGDEITMSGHPARNGAPAMNITKLVDAHGQALIGGGQ